MIGGHPEGHVPHAALALGGMGQGWAATGMGGLGKHPPKPGVGPGRPHVLEEWGPAAGQSGRAPCGSDSALL
eukprot:6183366-Pleurochrysis_carterae.AAC.6